MLGLIGGPLIFASSTAVLFYLRDYYGWLGDAAGMIASSAATDAATVKGYVRGFAEAACDELILMPCSRDPLQVDLLADAVLMAYMDGRGRRAANRRALIR